jgi:hypothetical protein
MGVEEGPDARPPRKLTLSPAAVAAFRVSGRRLAAHATSAGAIGPSTRSMAIVWLHVRCEAK